MRKTFAFVLFIIILVAIALALVLHERRGAPRGQAPVAQQAVDPVEESAGEPQDAAQETESGAVSERSVTEDAESEQRETALVRVYGTVTDASTGEALADARIFASPPDAPMFAFADPGDEGRLDTQSDENGSFEIEVDAAASPVLSCIATGYARADHTLAASKTSPPDAAAPDETTSERVDFLLQPGATIAGRVVDVQTRAGAPDVRVVAAGTQDRMFDQFRGGRRNEATTDENGYYAIEGLEPGSYRVTLRSRAAGYVFRPQDVRTLIIEEAARYEGVDFTVEKGAVVQGMVRNVENEPVEQALLHILPVRMLQTVMEEMGSVAELEDVSSTTGADGRYEMTGLDFDTDYRLRVNKNEYAEVVSEAFRIERDASPFTLDLTLTDGSRVSGVARFEDGAPAAEFELSLTPVFTSMMTGAFGGMKSTSTDPNGRFTFEQVSAGEYMLRPKSNDWFMPFSGNKSATSVTVDGVNDVTDIELVIEPQKEAAPTDGGAIAGVVLDPAGVPVEAVRVEAKQSDNPMLTAGATTAGDGTFSIAKLKAPLYDLSVRCEQGTASERLVAVGSRVTIRLKPPSTIRGMVVEKSGEPVASCKVRLDKQQLETSSNTMMQVFGSMFDFGGGGETTDAYGYFEFESVEPGDYLVRATSKTKGTGDSPPFTVFPGADVTNLRIVLEPGIRFAGTVRDRDRMPVAGAAISLFPEGDNEFQELMSQFMPSGMVKTTGSATSDSDGQFEIANVPPGTYRLSATHPEYARFTARGIETMAGRDVNNYEVFMTPGGGIGGQLMVNGEPKPGLMVQLMGPGGMQMATTDAYGRFDMSRVPAGSYMLVVTNLNAMSMSDMLVHQDVVDVIEGENIEIDTGPGAGMAVAGSITGAEPGAFTTISLRRPGGPEPADIDPFDFVQGIEVLRYQEGQAFIQDDGTFRLEGVEPGNYILEVFSVEFDLQNPDFEALANMDRNPVIRQEITVGEDPLDLNLELPTAAE